MNTTAPVIIIGAGQAGGRLALSLQEEGFEGTITLIGEENHLPYERPPLSKQVLLGESTPEATGFVTAELLDQQRITLRPACKVSAIHPERQQITLATGEQMSYQALVLATGGSPRPLTLPGSEATTIYYLRTQDDALRLKDCLQPDKRVGIIGGGFIGLEIASSAKQLGCTVTVLESAPRLAGRVLPGILSDRLLALHERNGVDVRLGVSIECLVPDAERTRIQLTSGETLDCDVIIVGIGIAPNQQLAAEAGLTVANGICVDEYPQTSAQHVYAIGDVAEFPANGKRQRIETWRNAEHQARYLAKQLTGTHDPFSDCLWFWSDQFDEGLQVIGQTGDSLIRVIRQADDDATFVCYLDAEHRLCGAAGMAKDGIIAKDIKLAERLIDMGKVLSPDVLEDATISLKSLLKGN